MLYVPAALYFGEPSSPRRVRILLQPGYKRKYKSMDDGNGIRYETVDTDWPLNGNIQRTGTPASGKNPTKAWKPPAERT